MCFVVGGFFSQFVNGGIHEMELKLLEGKYIYLYNLMTLN